MKVIVGLGNPGPEYDGTRHNVGWWMLDRLAHDWGLDGYHREGPALVADGSVGGRSVLLVKPLTYMNRSGEALAAAAELGPWDTARDVLVLVDDAALDVGRVRIRPSGGAGGHNGLRSVEEALGTDAYARLRIGVGQCPPGVDLARWVLAPMPELDEDVVVELLPGLTTAVEVWMDEGVEAAMNRFNR